MNFLAHIYLSGDDDGVIIGNFIADGIKGSKYKRFPQSIQKGILLHRGIDTFTDKHPIVRQSTARLHNKYGHYSGIIVDIIYDHFLARNWSSYHTQPLSDYVGDFYELLQSNYGILPANIQYLLPIMISDNWLLSYSTVEGISTILSKMNKRTDKRSKMNLAVIELELHYKEFEKEFTDFFEELIVYSKKKLLNL